MTKKKPKDIAEYQKWLKLEHNTEMSRIRNHYESSTLRIQASFADSGFWNNFCNNYRNYNDSYLIKTGYDLWYGSDPPEIVIKPFDSFLQKTYRKNVLDNKNWPSEPNEGWILPHYWYSRINDIIRTCLVVKYLDGVELAIGIIKELYESGEEKVETHLEARMEGYYAAHLYIKQNFEIPGINWDTEKIDISIEIQITIQLQEVIRRLLHVYYEDVRKKAEKDDSWPWNYQSDEFAANYLGHILHYVEGMIMDIREKQTTKERMK